MSPKAYVKMEFGVKMVVTMDTAELIFKGIITLLVRYDSGTNLPLLAGFQNDYVTEVVVILYRCSTDPANLNLSLWEN